jgi:hypothetical protein
MSDNKTDSFLDSFVFGRLATNYDPIGHRMGEEWRKSIGLDNKFDFDVDPTLPDGPLEKLWDMGMVGIGAIIILPFFLAFNLIIGPFRRNLRWPLLTRVSAVLAWGSIYCFSISPSFHRIEDELGEALTAVLQLGYIGMLLIGLVTIPMLMFLPLFRRDRPDKFYQRKARKAAEGALAARQAEKAVAK